MATKWHIQGEYFLACNCDYGCPCNFNARPSMGFCQGVVGIKIADGAYGGTRLDGLHAALAMKWPGAIHEGNGVAALFVDERATGAQREAMSKIVAGQAGPPLSIFASTWSHTTGPFFVNFDVRLAGKDTNIRIGDQIRVAFMPIRNPVTKVEAHSKVVLAPGMLTNELEQYTLKEFWVQAGPEIQYAHPGRCAELAKIQWEGEVQ